MNSHRAAAHSHESHALHILLASLIDYAGLFPPSAFAMKKAVSTYSHYRTGEYAWMVGRFIVPATRLAEFESDLPPERNGDGWHVSALVGPDTATDIDSITSFNRRHTGKITIDSVELKVERAEEIAAIRGTIPDWLLKYFEFPIDGDPAPFLEAIRNARARAKVRTGGVKPEMFPSSTQVARFLSACIEAGVPFKATAGLHHPVRCVRPLTYEADAAQGTMHGFLNVFLAAAFALAGMPEEERIRLLEDTAPDAFTFDATGASWRDQRIDNTHLLECRGGLAMSFGSCSIDEPIADLQAMNLL